MGTYYHWLKTKAPDRLPKRVVSIYATANAFPIPGEGGYVRHILREIGVCITDYRSGLPFRHGCDVLASYTSLLDCLQANALQDGNAVVMCHDISYTARLCGVWRAYSEGLCEIAGWTSSKGTDHFTMAISGNELLWVGLEGYLSGIWSDYEAIADEQSVYNAYGSVANIHDGNPAIIGACRVDMVSRKIYAFLYTHCNSVFRPTLAGIAWGLFRSRRWGQRIRIHGHEQANDCERKAFRGIPPICYAKGFVSGPIYECDINSMFGWLMQTRKLPCRLLSYGKICRRDVRGELRKGHGVIAYLSMDAESSPDWFRDYCTTIPDCKRIGCWLCGDELSAALDSGRDTAIQEGAIYRMGDLFGSFVEHIYSAKTNKAWEADRVAARLAKMLLCTFYGYWAAKAKRWVDYPKYWGSIDWGHTWCNDPKDGRPRPVRVLAGKAQMLIDKGEMAHSFPAISAYVTMYARMYMRECVELCGSENVHYTDTDSIHTSEVGFQRLTQSGRINGTRLGSFKIVDRHDAGEYFGPKRYILGERNTFAGLPDNASRQRADDFIYPRRESLAETAQRGWLDSVVVYQAHYTLR